MPTAGQISVGDIDGIQSQGIIAEVKHYDANNQEPNRFAVNELISDRTLHEIYLPQFEKSGGPVLMPWLGQVPAVVEAWYPGEEDGNAVAAILFGDANPSGKLPITFPRADGDTPAHTPQQWPGVNGAGVYSEGLEVGYRWYDAQDITPLVPFGYGLSYTTFSFSHLTVSRGSSGQVTVGADVTNTGHRAGAEVAQLYVADPAAAGEPPKQLKGFSKVFLRPGLRAHVTFTMGQRAFSVWDSASQAWTVAGGTYHVLVGNSSRDLPLQAPVTVAR